MGKIQAVAVVSAIVFLGCEQAIETAPPQPPPTEVPPSEPPPEPDPPAPDPPEPEPAIDPYLFNVSPVYYEDIITHRDPSAFASIDSLGKHERMALWSDGVRRPTGNWYNVFDARYVDDTTVRLWISIDFPRGSVGVATEYGALIGRTPTFLRTHFEDFVLRPDGAIAANGKSGPYFHHVVYWSETTGAQRASFEEIMIHEQAHIQPTLESIESSDAWRAAQEADTEFASYYARSRPDAEDIAETMILYVASRHRRDRIGEVNAVAIEEALAHRFAILDAQDWGGQWCPIVPEDCP